jgi:hypothetical protein
VNRLAANQRVYFSGGVPRLSVLDWHAVAVIDTIAALEPVAPGDAQLLPDHMPEVFMSFEHDGRQVSLRGELSLRSIAAADWRFTLTDGIQQRRTQPFRITLCAPLTLKAGGKKLETKTLDLGVDGCRLEAPTNLAPGTAVQTGLSLPGHDDAVIVTGHVIGDGDQVSFGGDPAVRSRLAGFVIAWQRATWRQRQALLRDAA